MKATFTPKVYSIALLTLLVSLVTFTARAQCPNLHATISNGPLVNKCAASPFVLMANPSGSANTYQWQQQMASGGSFEDITGAENQSYQSSLPGTYRVVVGNGTCFDTSSITRVIQLQLMPGSISGGPSSPICPDSYVGFLKGPSVPGDEAGLIKYQWQYKEGNGNYQNIPLAVGLDYNAGYITINTTFRRAVTDYCGNEVYSNELTFTTYNAPTPGNVQPAMQSINAGAIPVALTTAVAATGSGNLSYKWQWSLSINGPWTTIIEATSESYTPTDVNITTFFRRIVISDLCSFTATGQPVLVNVLNTLVLNAGILYSNNSCLFIGNTPYPIATKIYPAGGVPPYTIQWEAKPVNGNWALIPGESGDKLFPGPISQTTDYRKKVTDAVGTIAYSDIATLSVISTPLDPGAIYTRANIACLGSSPSQLISSRSATNFGEKGGYQWQVKTENGNWVDLPGATRGDYQPQPLTERSTFRRVFKDFCGPNGRIAFSNELVIDTKPAILAGEISPSTQLVLPGRVPRKLLSVSAPSGGTGTYSIWWEKADVAAGPFTKITGATSAEYQSPAANQSAYYRRVVRDLNCMAEKVTYIIEVFVPDYPPMVGGTLAGSSCVFVNMQPANLTSGSTPAGGIGPYTFVWESRTGTNSFSPINGATNEEYQPGVLSQTTQYRRRATDAYGSFAYSDTYTIQLITAPLVPGKIEVSNADVCAGSAPGIIKSVKDASGMGTGSHYQWQQRIGTGQYADIAGATDKDYAPPALNQTTYYRRAYIDECSGKTRVGYTNEVMIKATPYTTLLAGLIDGPFITCAGTAPGTIKSALNACGSCNLVYSWQMNDGSGWMPITGAGGPTYTPAVISNTTSYRRIVTDGLGRTSTSNTVEILVYPGIEAGVIGADTQRVCLNTTPSPIGLITDCHYTDGTVTYQWQMGSSNSGPWSDINGAVTPSYQPGAATASMHYRLKVMSTTCNAVVYTNVAAVLVKEQCNVQISSSAPNVSTCLPISPVALTYPIQACNADNIFEWQYDAGNSGTWIGTGTGLNNLMINSYYKSTDQVIKWRLKMTSVSCNNVSYSNELEIMQFICRTNGPTVYPNPTTPGSTTFIRTTEKPTKLSLMTIDGKRVELKVVSTSRGLIRFQTPLNIASGTYVLEITSTDGHWFTKLQINNK